MFGKVVLVVVLLNSKTEKKHGKNKQTNKQNRKKRQIFLKKTEIIGIN